ncbi:hypothetical protein GCM10009753_15020 [Streptantibioticus ferralitis]
MAADGGPVGCPEHGRTKGDRAVCAGGYQVSGKTRREGRAAWNVVTSSDAFTGEYFRRGGYLNRADRRTARWRRAAPTTATSSGAWRGTGGGRTT